MTCLKQRNKLHKEINHTKKINYTNYSCYLCTTITAEVSNEPDRYDKYRDQG